jgi:DNA-binding transcriptional LysR family regulator
MNVTFRQLRVFVEVARLGGALHLTPPAISLQVKEIESQVGLQLFDRSRRRA